jgi:hypothetical protein
MAQRLDLQLVLTTILGSSNVYFQPPPTLSMEYPCILYVRSDKNVDRANNGTYKRLTEYLVTHISQNPDSPIPDLIGELPMCKFNRFYTANNLNHDTYKLFF